MPVITSVKPQKNKKRVNIYLDDKFGFGLDLETYVKSGLKAEQELSQSAIENIVKEGELQSTYDKILRFATLRPRSEKEFKIWLTKHKVHQSIHEELFNKLKRLELMDDKKFAIWWLDQRKQFRNKSKRELVQELQIKGVNREIINQLVSKSISQKEQLASAKKNVEKRWHRWKMLEGFERRQKIFKFLADKGFDYDVIKEIVGEFLDD